MSFTSAGVPIPGETKATRLFERMFLGGNKAEVDAQIVRLQEERSILDTLTGRVKKLEARQVRRIGTSWTYFTSVRELEQYLGRGKRERRRTGVNAPMPEDIATTAEGIKQHRPILDVMKLALSTIPRVSYLWVTQSLLQNIDGVGPVRIPCLIMAMIPRRGSQLRTSKNCSSRKSITFGMAHRGQRAIRHLAGQHHGDVWVEQARPIALQCESSHLPSAALKHGQHFVFDKENNYPLTNLYVSMLQRLGVEADSFSSGKGTRPVWRWW